MQRSRRPFHRNHRREHTNAAMKRSLIGVVFGATALIALAVALGYVDFTADNKAVADQPVDSPQRVVSLAPSITELIFALDVDTLLVGVTRFCVYPPAADTLPEVGGYLDVNLEALVELDPDLVVLLKESEDTQKKLQALGLPFLTVNHQTIDGILESYQSVGHRLHSRQADSLAQAQRDFLDSIREMTMESSRPSVLLSIGHGDKPGVISSVYAAAQEGFYSEMLEIAGGRNVIEDNSVRYPALNAEGITALSPEYIIDIFPGGDHPPDRRFVRQQWSSLMDVPAVRNNRVAILSGQRFVIPGPRFTHIVEEFVSVLHPDLARNLSNTR